MGAPQRFGMKGYWIALVAISVFSVLPLISMLLAGAIATANGCAIGSAPSPCIILGADWGEALYTLALLSWLMFFTFPAAFVLFIIWMIVLTVHRIAWRRNSSGDLRP